jgi:hypothetical protein
MDGIHIILIAYEMRIEKDKKEKPSNKEVAFKESNNKNKEECKIGDKSNSESDA